MNAYNPRGLRLGKATLYKTSTGCVDSDQQARPDYTIFNGRPVFQGNKVFFL